MACDAARSGPQCAPCHLIKEIPHDLLILPPERYAEFVLGLGAIEQQLGIGPYEGTLVFLRGKIH
jgi:hypothetical protein